VLIYISLSLPLSLSSPSLSLLNIFQNKIQFGSSTRIDQPKKEDQKGPISVSNVKRKVGSVSVLKITHIKEESN
jgi:hypothetical protein